MNIQPARELPPPGETGVELTGTHALDVLADQFREMTDPARAKLTVKDIRVKKLGRWVVITVRHRGKDDNEITVRVSRAWATVLFQQLKKALGQ